MEAQWFAIDNINELKSGDVFETPSRIPSSFPIFAGKLVGAVKHVGMVLILENKLYVIHNPYGGVPVIEPFAKVFKDRSIERILRTNLPTDYILEQYAKCRNRKYDFFSYNCEAFIRSLTSTGEIGLDQRNVYATILLIIVILILLLLLLRKYR